MEQFIERCGEAVPTMRCGDNPASLELASSWATEYPQPTRELIETATALAYCSRKVVAYHTDKT